MITTRLPALVQRFFSQRLLEQQGASPHTVASYRDTFRLLLEFVTARTKLTPSMVDFADLDALAERVLAFQERYNTQAAPFDWTYTRHDLNTFLRRLDNHDQSITAGRPA